MALEHAPSPRWAKRSYLQCDWQQNMPGSKNDWQQNIVLIERFVDSIPPCFATARILLPTRLIIERFVASISTMFCYHPYFATSWNPEVGILSDFDCRFSKRLNHRAPIDRNNRPSYHFFERLRIKDIYTFSQAPQALPKSYIFPAQEYDGTPTSLDDRTFWISRQTPCLNVPGAASGV